MQTRILFALVVFASMMAGIANVEAGMLKKKGCSSCQAAPSCCEPACCEPVCDPCCGKKKGGLLDRLFGKKSSCCEPACCEPACCEPVCCEPAPTCCAPEPTCCDPCADCCDPCCSKKPRLIDRIRALFAPKKSCCDSCCEPVCEPACCQPAPTCCGN